MVAFGCCGDGGTIDIDCGCNGSAPQYFIVTMPTGWTKGTNPLIAHIVGCNTQCPTIGGDYLLELEPGALTCKWVYCFPSCSGSCCPLAIVLRIYEAGGAMAIQVELVNSAVSSPHPCLEELQTAGTVYYKEIAVQSCVSIDVNLNESDLTSSSISNDYACKAPVGTLRVRAI